MKKILILDGANLIYRAKFSDIFKNRDKEDLNDRSIIYSFINSYRKIIINHEPDEVFFVKEGVPVQRLETEPEYKSTRVKEKDVSFDYQRKLIKDELLPNIPGLTIAKHPEKEADDVIHWLAKTNSTLGNKCVIVSSDTDFVQSIDENISLYNPITKSFRESNITGDAYVTWKALKGDLSDNIKGFDGIGGKKAFQMATDEKKLFDYLNSTNQNEKFKINFSMIKFENIEENDIIIMSKNDYNNEQFEKFKVLLKENYRFNSITGKNSWHNWIKPFKLNGV
jgi:DNA polymerase-1